MLFLSFWGIFILWQWQSMPILGWRKRGMEECIDWLHLTPFEEYKVNTIPYWHSWLGIVREWTSYTFIELSLPNKWTNPDFQPLGDEQSERHPQNGPLP
jgi:hypothetical protein